MVLTVMIEKVLNDYSVMVKKALENYTAEDKLCPKLMEAMRYSLLAGGKCIRPALVLEFYRQFDENYEKALPIACAFEMIHAYSLIHDDMPIMDNDDMRRGKPACHIAFGEQTALLAGDALQTLAFETALSCDSIYHKPKNIIAAASALAEAAGAHGMAGGQMLDLENEGKSTNIEHLKLIHSLKTGAMIIGAAKAGCLLAGATPEETDAAEEYAKAVGLAYQIVDDILDVTADESALGKPIGSDMENGKQTYVTLLGIEKSKDMVRELSESAKAVAGGFKYGQRLCELVDYLAQRGY